MLTSIESMRHNLFCTAIVLFWSSPSLAEENPRLEAKRIIDTASDAVKKNREACDKANEKPLEDARRALQELASRLAKEGDTSGATAVLKKIETLKADVLGKPSPTPPRASTPVVEKPVPQKPLLQRLVGKWTHPNHGTIYIIDPAGGIQEVFKTDGRLHTKGQLQAMADGTAETVMNGGMKYRVREAGADNIAMELWDSEGRPQFVGFVLTRIK